MIYFVGGAPRAGKSILGQRVAARLRIGWISTDILEELLRVDKREAAKNEWNAAPESIVVTAEKFFPYLMRFVWGISSLADNYLIDGVDFLPSQVGQLSTQYEIRAVFLGCSQMTLDRFDRFPGRSQGYADLPEEMRRRIVQDVPLWSEFILQEAKRFGYPYIDTSDNFSTRLNEAEAVLMMVWFQLNITDKLNWFTERVDKSPALG
jgi:2-phosphoglycerate kinase